MAEVTRKDVDEWVEMIARLHDNTATDLGDEREAERAVAMLWSGFGYLDAPLDVLRMFVQAIEVGYMAALADVRDGKVTVES
ncbi:hypothetical protein [Micromonospora sp. CNB394]|uniref:hypothetical protein n=1 Tax=Micromonospora sp. CNB394 TaxID=1169151 RepID=UPI0003785ACD|nr:hypothetical protein [Micromonospora sp. CNB394]